MNILCLYVCQFNTCMPTKTEESVISPGTPVVVVSRRVGTGNWTWVLFKSSKWTSLRSLHPNSLTPFKDKLSIVCQFSVCELDVFNFVPSRGVRLMN